MRVFSKPHAVHAIGSLLMQDSDSAVEKKKASLGGATLKAGLAAPEMARRCWWTQANPISQRFGIGCSNRASGSVSGAEGLM